MNSSILFRHRPAGAPGVALIVTLLMMAVLTLMVVGLAGVMRNEQAAARNLTYQMLAEQLALVGAQEAMQKVMVNSPTSSPNGVLASGPGWLSIGTNLTALFQTNQLSRTNLEAIGTNSLVLSLMAGTTGNIPAGWSNIVSPVATTNALIGRYSWWVDDEGSKLNLNTVGVGTNSKALVAAGRNPAPFSGDFIFVNPSNGAISVADMQMGQKIADRTNFFPTTESLRDTNITRITNLPGVSGTVYRRTKGHVTAFSQSADLTPWGSPKFNLNDLTNIVAYPTPESAVAAVKAQMTTNAWEGLFGPEMSLGRKFGGGLASSTDANNHGDLVLEQIAANIVAAVGRPVVLNNPLRDYQRANPATSFVRHRNSMPLRIASHYQGPYLEQVRTRVDYTINAQTNVAGRLLIWVRVINPTSRTFNNWSVKVQPRKWKYVVAPATRAGFGGAKAANLVFGPPLTGFSSLPDEGFNIVPGPAWEVPSKIFDKSWPLDRFYVSNNLSFSARETKDLFFSNVISFTLANVQPNELPATVSRAYVMLDQVGLYESSTPSVTSLRDWLTHDDLAQLGNYRNDGFQDYGQFSFHPGLYLGAGNAPINVSGGFPSPSVSLFGAESSLGVRKIDPQARFHVNFFLANPTQAGDMGRLRAGGWTDSTTGPRIWTTNPSFACSKTDGSVTGIPYLWPDPAPGVLDVTNHPHFVDGYRSTNGISSIAQLGAIHTGIPWRTLRLQPQPPQERQATNNATNSPPDWILLDLFTATNPLLTNRPMLNLNSFTLGMAGNQPGPVSVGGNPPIRTWAVLGALGVWTTNRYDTNLLIANGIPVTATNNVANYRSSLVGLVTNLQAAFLNMAGNTTWSANSAWPSHRIGFTGTKLPAYGLGLRGEFLELRGMAEDINNQMGEDVIEGRLRPYLDLLSTRSDTFCVWSWGQALAVSGNTTNVMAEIRKQTVFRRVPRIEQGQVAGYDLEVIYTRNHVLE